MFLNADRVPKRSNFTVQNRIKSVHITLAPSARICYIEGMNFLATYVHSLDPVILDIPGTPLALRWYGLSYVAGFVLGYLVLLWMSRRKLYCVEEEKLGDFITSVCIFGVLCGGRLGEFFFYWLPEYGWAGIVNDLAFVWGEWTQGHFTLPWVFRVWEGGMASHGGIIGVLCVGLYWCYRHKWNALQVTDGLAIVSSLGICFGRIANFINGELWGRITDSAIGVKFPTELATLPTETQAEVLGAVEQVTQAPFRELMQQGEYYMDTLLRLCREMPQVQEVVAAAVPARYPSQLFESFGEGALIFAVLFTLRLVWKKAPAGIFSALFAFMYAAARITCEAFKEPDAGVWYGVTEGQWLSFGIVAIGIVFFVFALRNMKRGAADAA